MAESTEDIRHACGVFGCVASGVWPTQLDVANVLCLGLIGIQHRFDFPLLTLFIQIENMKTYAYTHLYVNSRALLLQL